MNKTDKSYAKSTVLDFTKTTKALNAMKNGEFDAIFFVSAPRTRAIKRMINTGVRFRDIDDWDFIELSKAYAIQNKALVLFRILIHSNNSTV